MDSTLYDLSAWGWCVAIFCGVVVGMSKCGLTGLGSLAVPLMATVLPAKVSTGALLPVLIIGDAMGVTYFNRHANWRLLTRLMPAALVGIVIGFLLMRQAWVDDQVIKVSIGILVLALVALNALRERFLAFLPIGEDAGRQSLVIAIVFGVIAGITTMLANAAGPIMLIYLLAMRLPKDAFIGTSAWYFMVLNWCKVPFMVQLGLINPDSLAFNIKLSPAILVGGLLGIYCSGKLSNRGFNRLVQILTILAALKLLF
ncbi:MAG: sulfite exporter TauE/SafE family protein [Lentisphaeria bacterium]|jgi:uncharacterized membrane protein YfcA